MAADTERARAIVRAYGPDHEAVLQAAAWAVKKARELGNPGIAVMVHQLENMRSAAKMLGCQRPDRVVRERSARAAGTPVTFHNSRSWADAGRVPQVCLWLTDDDMARVEGIGAPATVLVTWTKTEGRAWAVGHGAIDLRGGDPSEDVPELGPVVLEALRTIEGVNPSDSLSHPSDKGRVIQAFRTLYRAGYEFPPLAVQAALVGGRLSDRTAAAVAEIAQKVIDGHRFRSREPLRADILEIWRAEAEGRPPPD